MTNRILVLSIFLITLGCATSANTTTPPPDTANTARATFSSVPPNDPIWKIADSLVPGKVFAYEGGICNTGIDIGENADLGRARAEVNALLGLFRSLGNANRDAGQAPIILDVTHLHFWDKAYKTYLVIACVSPVGQPSH